MASDKQIEVFVNRCSLSADAPRCRGMVIQNLPGDVWFTICGRHDGFADSCKDRKPMMMSVSFRKATKADMQQPEPDKPADESDSGADSSQMTE
jgi:hypothetical protein